MSKEHRLPVRGYVDTLSSNYESRGRKPLKQVDVSQYVSDPSILGLPKIEESLLTKRSAMVVIPYQPTEELDMKGKYYRPIRDLLDALPLEYKLSNREPTRQIDVSHFISDPLILGIPGTEETHLKEKSL